MFGAAVVAIVAANDPSVDAADPPVNLVLALTALQDAAFVFAAWITIRLVLGQRAAGAVRARARQEDLARGRLGGRRLHRRSG